MEHINSRCVKTLIWLGKSETGVEEVFKLLLGMLIQSFRAYLLDESPERNWQKLHSAHLGEEVVMKILRLEGEQTVVRNFLYLLAKRRWCSRAWVLQS